MKATVVDAVGATLGTAVRSGATDAINSETADPVEAVHELLPDGVGSVFEPESAWKRPSPAIRRSRSEVHPSCHQQMLNRHGLALLAGPRKDRA